MDKKPSVLLVHNYYKLPGGEDTVVANERKLLEDHGHKVVLYSRNNSELENLGPLKKMVLPFVAIFNVKTYKNIKEIIRKEKIDIIHVHNTLTLISPSAYYAAFSSDIPVVQTVHNFRMICPGALLYYGDNVCEKCIHDSLKYALKQKCYRNSKVLTLAIASILKVHRILKTYKKINYICLTEFNKNKLLEGNGNKFFDESKMFIKPNFSLGPRQIIPYIARKRQFVFVGRPEKVKGIDILLKAWRQIKDFKLVICGTCDEMDKIKEYICIHHMENVILMGKVENNIVKKILAESLAMIMPSQWYEGFPMVIVESYSCGTPVLGSDMGNTGTLICDGITGYKFRHDSSFDLQQKVLQMHDMTESCYAFFKENFDAELNYKKLLEIYNEVMEKRLISR